MTLGIDSGRDRTRSWDQPKMAAENWHENADLKKLYVSKLKPETTHERLVEYFQTYGEVLECKVVKDQQGNPRGFAFVSMADQAIVDSILDQKPHTIDGQTVFMRRAIPKDDPDPLAQTITKKLFIGGLNDEMTEQDVLEVIAIFTPHVPEEIKFMRDRNTNKFKGYAFAVFHSEDIVDKLFIVRHCTIKKKRVELKKAEEMGQGGGGRGRGMRGGRGGGEPRGRGGRGGGGRGAHTGGYSQSYDQYGGYGGYSGGGGGEYDHYGGGGYEGYGNGYSSYGSGGGGYGSGGYGGAAYGGGYDMGQGYRSESSGYGPNRRGRGRGGGGYQPY
ncbi:heterogeneous nuclear ribonucleoprotein A0-like isoform X1 [Oculina patagonica]